MTNGPFRCRPSGWRHGLAALAFLLTATLGVAAEPTGYLEDFPRARAYIETGRACHILDLYLAVTPRQRFQGLMHIRKLDEYEGMLFTYEQEGTASLWMKNTYISLDMLFIRTDGRIAHIAASTTPLSEATISAPMPVSHVLELVGGFSARHEVAVGDRLVLMPPLP